MKCQILFSTTIKKNITNFLSAELTQTMIQADVCENHEKQIGHFNVCEAQFLEEPAFAAMHGPYSLSVAFVHRHTTVYL